MTHNAATRPLPKERCRHCKTPLVPKRTSDGLRYNACACTCCVSWLDVEKDES